MHLLAYNFHNGGYIYENATAYYKSKSNRPRNESEAFPCVGKAFTPYPRTVSRSPRPFVRSVRNRWAGKIDGDKPHYGLKLLTEMKDQSMLKGFSC